MSVHLEDIPYRPDSCSLFSCIRDLPAPVFLDSGYPHSRAGRYDILAADPVEGLLPEAPPVCSEAAGVQYLADLAAAHSDYFGNIKGASPDLPFCGGILGCLGYGFGEQLQGLAHEQSASALTPTSSLALYDWCIVQDHLLQRAVLISQPRVTASRRAQLLSRLRGAVTDKADPFTLTSPFAANLSETCYRKAFERIQAYIHAGDCYQVNLTQQFTAGFQGDPWAAYRVLRAVAGAQFSAYLEPVSGESLLCLSPERFLSLHGQHVETSPIKGTRPRYDDQEADRLAIEELRSSAKDRAENLMIVDLLRNDLGRSCVPGTIHVDRLFEIQSFATVHHLVSTISGELPPGHGAFELLRDCFPGGSITGAPKRRAMEIIAELEPHQREAYCGSVVYISADGRMDSNIAIRSLIASGGEIHCWGGGGIVADSHWQQEYQECYDKVGKLLLALEQLPS